MWEVCYNFVSLVKCIQCLEREKESWLVLVPEKSDVLTMEAKEEVVVETVAMDQKDVEVGLEVLQSTTLGVGKCAENHRLGNDGDEDFDIIGLVAEDAESDNTVDVEA
jgi:hypothetical protein